MLRLYIDFSETFYLRLSTGIQRVVRNVIERKETFGKYGFDDITGIIQNGNCYRKAELNGSSSFKFTGILNVIGARLRNFADSFFGKNGKEMNTTKLEAVRQEWNQQGGKKNGKAFYHEQLVFICKRMLQELFKASRYLDGFFMSDSRIEFTNNDILFLPDAFWGWTTSIAPIMNAKKKGTRIIILCHDIIPLTHGEFCDKAHVRNFQERFAEILPIVDGFICNSQFTLRQLSDYIYLYYPQFKHIHFDFFHLGCDIDKKQEPYKFLKQNDIFLMVGTIEPRKNYDYILDVFHGLWSRGLKVKLCIVGKIGWNCQRTLKRITESPYYRKYLFMFNDVKDSDLTKFYCNCKALIFSSLVEGFGLPLVEAMHYKKPIFASDIAVFREIGGDYPYYFNLENQEHLRGLITKFEEELLPKKASLPLIWTWDRAVKELAEKLSKLEFENS